MKDILTASEIRALQSAYNALNNVCKRLANRHSAEGNEYPFNNWVLDDLTEEEWQAKPIDQKLFESRDLIAWVLVDQDPDGSFVCKRKRP